MSKFYAGGQDMSVAGGSYMVSKAKASNTFRNDGVALLGNGSGTMQTKDSQGHENLHVRTSQNMT